MKEPTSPARAHIFTFSHFPIGDRRAIAACALIGLVYVVLRAALVPFIHDEARTFQTYVLTGEFLPFQAHWDAGNHLLATALAQISQALFGPGEFSMRLFNVLAFALYAWYAVRLASAITDRLVRGGLLPALLFTPFVIEFFSLFRGYGLSIAFQVMALHHLVRFLREGGRKQMVLALAATALATTASLTLLLQSLLMVGLTALFIPMRARGARSWIVWILVGVLPTAFLAWCGVELAERGALYYGSTQGLVDGTAVSLLWNVAGLWSRWLVMGIGVVAVALFWPALHVLAQRRFNGSDTLLAVCSLLLLGEACGRLVLGEGFGMLYPVDRTAMHLVPLFLIACAAWIDRAAEQRRSLRWVGLLFFWFPLRTAATANLDHTTYWAEQSIPDEVFGIVAEKQRHAPRPLVIGGYHQNAGPWSYGNYIRGRDLNGLDHIGFPQPNGDLMLIDPTFFDRPEGFRTLYAAPHGRLLLLERREPLRLERTSDTTLSRGPATGLYMTLWESFEPPTHEGDVFVEVEAVISSSGDPSRLVLVVDASDSLDNHLQFETNDLDDVRRRWQRDTLHVLRRIPAANARAHRRVVYLWNVRQEEYEVHEAHVTLYRSAGR